MIEVPSEINICLYGLNRSLSKTRGSICTNLLDPLSRLGISSNIYCCFVRIDDYIENPRSGESLARPEDSENSILVDSTVNHVDQATIDRLVDWDLIFSYGDLYADEGKTEGGKLVGSTYNVVRALCSLYSVYQMIPDTKASFPIVFIRPDIEILSPLAIESILTALCAPAQEYSFGSTSGVAVVPTWQSWDGVNDRFAVCTPGASAESYASRVRFIGEYLKLSARPLHPESFLLHILSIRGVRIMPLIDTLMIRVRAGGKVHHEAFSDPKCDRKRQFGTESWHSLVNLNRDLSQALVKTESDLKILFTKCAQRDETIQALLNDQKRLEQQLQDLQALECSLSQKLQDTHEETELSQSQLYQVQEALEIYFLQSRELEMQTHDLTLRLDAQCEKLTWLRAQRELLMQLVHAQSHLILRMENLISWLRSSARQTPSSKNWLQHVKAFCRRPTS